ncbi:hypothetical protein [Flavobacterium gyeonganense]|uniref:Uncharacterized protein n=1 Tax=Flavobacterium gyeonganense TaxID=1310418 RepID=A0ABV5HFA7_9FLAO|nr:hypothetical protein [Flavobacterium gyeonganense]
MENQNNNEYGQTDPDFIDQNTPVDGSEFQNENHFQKDLNKESKAEFGESDPDFIDQNTIIDNDNYAKDEDPYQYQEEFIEDLKNPKIDFETNRNINSENIVNEEKPKTRNGSDSDEEKENE